MNYRTDRLWMLHLIYAGINSEDDALICIRNSVLEIILSVYASPLSDVESKELILRVSCGHVNDFLFLWLFLLMDSWKLRGMHFLGMFWLFFLQCIVLMMLFKKVTKVKEQSASYGLMKVFSNVVSFTDTPLCFLLPASPGTTFFVFIIQIAA